MCVSEYDTPEASIPKQQNSLKPSVSYAEQMGFGERLRAAREAKRMTGEFVGAQVGVSRQTISHWEKGRYEPSIEQVKGLCNVLAVSADWLFERETLDLPPEAIEEARLFAALGPEDRRRWRTIRMAMFSPVPN